MTTFSINLETKGMFETGGKFLISFGSSEVLLMRSFTIAVFRTHWNVPETMVSLATHVSAGRIATAHSNKREVDILRCFVDRSIT